MSNTTPTRSIPVAHLDELAEGSMKLVKVDGHRVCLVRTSTGVHALDHACPHEGYGLTQGSLDGELLTCAWHNWKFRVDDGTCVLGEEAVRVHDVDVDADGAISVELNRPDPAALKPQLLDSLRRGIAKDYLGQISRDVVRLLKAGAEPAEIMAVAVEFGAPRGEYGWEHEIASATDCLAMVDLWEGDERGLPLVQGIVGIAGETRDRPVQPLPEPAAIDVDIDGFRRAVERENVAGAQSIVRAAISRGDTAADLLAWFAAAVSDHHLSYGHGAIYVHKGFELLELIGWDHADTVLSYLVPTIVYGTREDTLPYMKPFMRAVRELDLAGLGEAARRTDATWNDGDELREVLLGRDRTAPVAAVAEALRAGAGVDGVLDAVVDAASVRLLRYDVAGERDFHDDFGWLDITHAVTYAHAVRWLHERVDRRSAETMSDLVRLTLYTVFQANWTGRHEWHSSVGEPAAVEPLGNDVESYGDELQRLAQQDTTTAFIVHAHAVKNSRAAALESRRRNSPLVLDATLRFLTAPKLERFVAANVTRSIDFLNGRTQRD